MSKIECVILHKVNNWQKYDITKCYNKGSGKLVDIIKDKSNLEELNRSIYNRYTYIHIYSRNVIKEDKRKHFFNLI